MSNRPTSSSFRDYLGGLFSSKTFDENMSRRAISAISLEIYAIFEDVLASLLCCWVNDSDTYMNKDLCLNENGILAYNPDEIKFQGLISDDISIMGDKKGSISLSNKPNFKPTRAVKAQIVNISFNLFLSNPYEFMNRFICLWLNEKNRFVYKDKQYKLSMIEMLVSLNIPVEIVLNAIVKNINAVRIKEVKKSKVKIKDSYPFYLNKENCEYEAKLCHLIYSYIILNPHVKVDKNIVDIWNEAIGFFTVMLESKAPSTLFWTYEVLDILLHKLPIRETSHDKTVRTRLTTILTHLFHKSMEVAINNKFDVMFEESTHLILPMSPSIYEKVALEIYGKEIYVINSLINERSAQNPRYQIETTQSVNVFKPIDDLTDNTVSDQSIRNFYHMLYDYVTNGTVLKNEELLLAYRNIGFITLKSLFYHTMKHIYLPDKTDKLVIHIQTIVKNLILIMNERIGYNKIYVDLATEFFHNLMTNASLITSNSCKSQIMDFFLEPVCSIINF